LSIFQWRIKELLARTYDQMGYMAEAATWRNSYLNAARLRNGPPKKAIEMRGKVREIF
jgi:alkyl sulfatase BDS1-like metallo-beta-lactamase superfamily hydrolase